MKERDLKYKGIMTFHAVLFIQDGFHLKERDLKYKGIMTATYRDWPRPATRKERDLKYKGIMTPPARPTGGGHIQKERTRPEIQRDYDEASGGSFALMA